MQTLWELINTAPDSQIAIVSPELGARVSYKDFRAQVQGMADDLAALGIKPGDRVATILQNGMPAIVSFLAASVAGTAAPLNPGYRYEEVLFYLEDTNAKVLLCPPEGADEARRAAQDRGVPTYTLQTDALGTVTIEGAPKIGRASCRERV